MGLDDGMAWEREHGADETRSTVARQQCGKDDCIFLYFKETGKWKYEGRGVFPAGDVDRKSIVAANGSMPGISGDASDMIVVVLPDDGCSTGFAYPRMLLTNQ